MGCDLPREHRDVDCELALLPILAFTFSEHYSCMKVYIELIYRAWFKLKIFNEIGTTAETPASKAGPPKTYKCFNVFEPEYRSLLPML